MTPMLVVVAQRWVDARPHVDSLTGEVRTDARASGASEADLCALEHALRVAGKLGGRCVAVTAGPPAAEEMLRQALAAGADEVLRIHSPSAIDPALEDSAETARVLATGLTARFGQVDLVLCGDHSIDRGTGSTPAYLAERLGAAQALGLLDVEVDGVGLRVLRRLDGGRRESLAVPLPAVCSVEPTTVRLRRAALPAMLAARRAVIPHIAVDAGTGGGAVRVKAVRSYRPRARVLPAPAGDDARWRMLELTGALVDRTPPRVVTPSSPAQAAEELLGFLHEHGYLAAGAPAGGAR
ncbi:MAG: Electron transfer flavoprotein alpha/beta-subunit [Actinomycetia bacterium]|nr:Electron transfer flavoprotein alpha/beta-subunit [Actinomycetes bacterium]